MAKKESRTDIKAPKQVAPKISSLQISEPPPIVDPPPLAPPVNNDKMAEIIEGYEDGMMFVCTKETFDECMSLRLLGLPFAQMKVVKALQAEKSALFLFNMSDRRLHGLFHASSAGGANINRDAWNKGSSNSSPFPAQIEFVIARDCEPIHEKEFKHVFPDKHRIRKLDKVEVQKLVRLFLRDCKSTSLPATKRPVTQVSSDKTIPKTAVSISVKNTKVDGTKPAVVAEKKTEPVAKAQPAFQWAAAPPKFAWGSKKPEKEELPVVIESVVAPVIVATPSPVVNVDKQTASSVIPEPAPVIETALDTSHSETKSNVVSKPNWNEDDLWGPSDAETKTHPAQSASKTSIPNAMQSQKPPTPQQHAQPVQSPQLTAQSQPQQSQLPLQTVTQQVQPLAQHQSKSPQPIAQHIQSSSAFVQQIHQPQQSPFTLQPNAFQSHHAAGAQLPKVHHQSSLFPSALFPPPPSQSSQPLQMHFDDSHWTQDTWKDESVWGSTNASEGWTSWGRSFDSNLLFGGSVTNHIIDYTGDDLTNFEQDPIEYEEDLPHGPKCACIGCMPNLPPNLGSLLEFVGLSDCYPNFAAEQMDIEALSMCDDTHLHEMNFVVGARVKLGALIRQLQKRNDLGGLAA